ncbi:MAG: hypothetical protein HN867_05295 [Deltaproteobacteria bacterium]|jgi:hypothetical protein|nr:hypothetical protein [Deltaproteobacteria bacterium]MBT7202892.1 hypothetical protein [Deltaproteobacteria bacterium]
MPNLSAAEYPTFFQNLSQRVQAREISSLHVLGEDFFSLVDMFSQQLFEEFQGDLLLLEMEPESFHWDLQVLTNQFLRKSIDSPLQLRPFCRQLRQQMQNPTFADEIYSMLKKNYQDHFYQVPQSQLLI